MKRFTKQFLIKALCFNEKEADIIQTAQRLFPELLVNESDNLKINSLRQLYLQLGIDKSNWSRWTKKNVIDNEFYTENNDWWGFVIMTNGNETKDFSVTIDFAKHLCMMSRTEQANICRQYFILMEKAVKKMSEWLLVRNPQKEGYREMCQAIDTSYKNIHDGQKPNVYIYANNADMINLALLGHKSKSIREIIDIDYNDSIRDYLTLKVNKAIYELEQLNASLLYSNIDFKTRKMIIENTVNKKYLSLRVEFSTEFAKELAKIND